MTYESVKVDGGKYEILLYENGQLEALRHGQPWQDLTGNNLVYWLAVELRNARVALVDLIANGGLEK